MARLCWTWSPGFLGGAFACFAAASVIDRLRLIASRPPDDQRPVRYWARGARTPGWVAWFDNVVGSGIDFVYPEGYQTDHYDEPTLDLQEKLKAMRIVVDPGTEQERTYLFSGIDEIGKLLTLGEFLPALAAQDAANPAWTQPGLAVNVVMHPLSVGKHDVVVTWLFSGQHCDGFGTSTEFPYNCAGPGAFNVGLAVNNLAVWDLVVVPR